MTNLLFVLVNLAALAGTLYSVIAEKTALFALCLAGSILTALYIFASKLGFTMFQSGEASPVIYICRKGKTFHLDRSCPELRESKVVRVPASYAYRNHMKPCPRCTASTAEEESAEGAKEDREL